MNVQNLQGFHSEVEGEQSCTDQCGIGAMWLSILKLDATWATPSSHTGLDPAFLVLSNNGWCITLFSRVPHR